MILVDTCVLIDWANLDTNPDESYAASILTRAEFEFSIHNARTAQVRAARARRLIDLDKTFSWLPFTTAATVSYGILATAIHRAGAAAQARRTDTFIAAQAHALGVPLMTLNPTDFAHVADLVALTVPRRRR